MGIPATIIVEPSNWSHGGVRVFIQPINLETSGAYLHITLERAGYRLVLERIDTNQLIICPTCGCRTDAVKDKCASCWRTFTGTETKVPKT
jgi:DNA-directed RNA polymerase subunit RPC12/RpoP